MENSSPKIKNASDVNSNVDNNNNIEYNNNVNNINDNNMNDNHMNENNQEETYQSKCNEIGLIIFTFFSLGPPIYIIIYLYIVSGKIKDILKCSILVPSVVSFLLCFIFSISIRVWGSNGSILSTKKDRTICLANGSLVLIVLCLLSFIGAVVYYHFIEKISAFFSDITSLIIYFAPFGLGIILSIIDIILLCLLKSKVKKYNGNSMEYDSLGNKIEQQSNILVFNNGKVNNKPNDVVKKKLGKKPKKSKKEYKNKETNDHEIKAKKKSGNQNQLMKNNVKSPKYKREYEDYDFNLPNYKKETVFPRDNRDLKSPKNNNIKDAKSPKKNVQSSNRGIKKKRNKSPKKNHKK
jgi:hypothetical protein